MKKIMGILLHKEDKFFAMLSELSQNALEASKELKIFIEDYAALERGERKARAYAIKKIEHKNDEISRNIFENLNRNSKTSIGRNDIKELAVLLDDLTDLINSAASKFVLLSIERIEKPILQLAEKVHDCIGQVEKTMGLLKKNERIEHHYIKIRELEREADDIYNNALSELFHFYKNSIDIIKYKEVYEVLEKTMDTCKDIADVAENIAMKRN